LREAESAFQVFFKRFARGWRPVTEGRSNAEVWRSRARGSILDRMRVPGQAPGGSAERRPGADEALGPAAPLSAVPTG